MAAGGFGGNAGLWGILKGFRPVVYGPMYPRQDLSMERPDTHAQVV